MAEVGFTIPSSLIGYSNAVVGKLLVDDDITPEGLARLHWEWNLRFLAEQDKIANEPVTEEQEKAITKAASESLTDKLPATKVEESKTDEPAEKAAGEGDPPWDATPEPAKKPWQNKPKFENLF